MKIFGTDYDGVIINIEPQKAAAFGDILNKEWDIDKDEAVKLWIATGGSSRRYKFDYYYEKQFNMKLPDDVYQAVEEKFSSLLKTVFYPKTELLPGALDLLKYARSNFDFTFVSSGIPMEEIKYLVTLNKVSEYFDLILGTNEVFTNKQEHFKKIISEKEPDLLVYIADGIEDMRITHEFSISSIGVTSNHSKEELINSGAVKVVDDNMQALSYIKSLTI